MRMYDVGRRAKKVAPPSGHEVRFSSDRTILLSGSATLADAWRERLEGETIRAFLPVVTR